MKKYLYIVPIVIIGILASAFWFYGRAMEISPNELKELMGEELMLSGTYLFPYGGGLGTSTPPSFGQIPVGNSEGVYTLTATSSLGITASAAWGAIIGTLSNQTDLQNELNAKQDNITVTYPIVLAGVDVSLAFGTTTANTWSDLQTFTSGISVSGDTITDFAGTNLTVTAGSLNVDDPFTVTNLNFTYASGTLATISGKSWLDGLVIMGAGYISTGSSTLIGDFKIDGNATTTGEFVVNTKNIGDYLAFFNGTFIQKFNATSTSDGTTVTAHIEQTKDTSANLTMRFSSGDVALITPTSTPLTAGSDNNPTMNYLFIPEATKVLTVSTSGYPSDEEHIKVSTYYVQSALGVQEAGGTFITQNWNDFAADDVNEGHITHMTERERRFGAKWFSGVAGDGDNDYLDIPSNGVVNLKSTSGIVYQMHKQVYPAFDTSGTDIAHIVNQFGNAFATTTNLFLNVTADSTGTPLGNNKYFNIFIWGVANRTDQHVTIMINLPGGTYATQNDAEQDVSGFDILSIPREFSLDSSTGFAIARLTIQKTATTWIYKSTVDCRQGGCAGGATGGSLGALTNFSDNVFTIFDADLNTRIGTFNAGGITAGNTRDLSFPDSDGTLALLELEQTFTVLQQFGKATTSELTVDVVYDSNGSPGSSGEVLSSTVTGTDWIAAGTGDVSVSGTPSDNQIAIWTDGTTIEGVSGLTYDGSNLLLTGDIGSTGSRITKGWFVNVESDNMFTVGGTSLSLTFSPIAGSASILTVGALDTGSITSGFTSIDVGAGTIETTGTMSSGISTITESATIASSSPSSIFSMIGDLYVDSGTSATTTFEGQINFCNDGCTQGFYPTYSGGTTTLNFW